MESKINREEALDLLKKYNKEPFHIQHGLTVEGVMRWFAGEAGYGDEEEYWGITGLLHDIDFELYPEEHCLKAPEMLRKAGVGEDVIHSVVSHGYGITVGRISCDYKTSCCFISDYLLIDEIVSHIQKAKFPYTF